MLFGNKNKMKTLKYIDSVHVHCLKSHLEGCITTIYGTNEDHIVCVRYVCSNVISIGHNNIKPCQLNNHYGWCIPNVESHPLVSLECAHGIVQALQH